MIHGPWPQMIDPTYSISGTRQEERRRSSFLSQTLCIIFKRQILTSVSFFLWSDISVLVFAKEKKAVEAMSRKFWKVSRIEDRGEKENHRPDGTDTPEDTTTM